jgi:hypothetical protein
LPLLGQSRTKRRVTGSARRSGEIFREQVPDSAIRARREIHILRENV